MKRVSVLSLMILSALSWIWTGCYTTFPIAGRADAAASEPYADDRVYETDLECGGPGLVVDDIGNDDVYVEPGLCIDFHFGDSWACYPYRSWSGMDFTWTNHGWPWDPWPVIWLSWFDYPRPWIAPVVWHPFPHPWNPWHHPHWDRSWAFHQHEDPGWNFNGKHHADWSRDYRQPVLERRSFDRRGEYAAVSGKNRTSPRTGDAGRRETAVIAGGGRDPSGAGMGSGRTGRTGTRQASARAAGEATPASARGSSRAGRKGMTREVQAENPRPDQNAAGQEIVRSTDLRAALRDLRSVSNEDEATLRRSGGERQSHNPGRVQSASELLSTAATVEAAEQKSRVQEARQAAEKRTESMQAVRSAERKPESRQTARVESPRQENHVPSAAPSPRTRETPRTQVSPDGSGGSGKKTELRSRAAIRGRQ